ncbi:hypothetical protein GCWU000342_02098 [Shuttleworthella satelles DSM 14600]|uniref:Uncharacterized protein n=1 Tax=Shuttleworthella satelles DSM 14600 TaxID=626523 RepID=C4GDC5_9FIRM|nr:hypothetical protein GCWU000342_02098 [Shuttleworthia satelles DSM 14600]
MEARNRKPGAERKKQPSQEWKSEIEDGSRYRRKDLPEESQSINLPDQG